VPAGIAVPAATLAVCGVGCLDPGIGDGDGYIDMSAAKVEEGLVAAVDDCGFQAARKSRIARRSLVEVPPLSFGRLDTATDTGCAFPKRTAVALRRTNGNASRSRRAGRECPHRPGSSSSVQPSSGALDAIISRADRRNFALDSTLQPLIPLVLAPPGAAPPIMSWQPQRAPTRQNHPQEEQQQHLRELPVIDPAAEVLQSRASSSSAPAAETAETTNFAIAKAAAAAAEAAAEAEAAIAAPAAGPTFVGGSISSRSHTRADIAHVGRPEQVEHIEGQVVGLEDLPRMGPAGTLPALWPACSESGADVVKAQPHWADDMFTGWGCEAEQGSHAMNSNYDLEERDRELATYIAQTCSGISVPPKPRVVKPDASRWRKISRDRLGLRTEHVATAAATPRVRYRPTKLS